MGIVRELRDGLANLVTGAGTAAEIQSHVAKIEARLAIAERRADHLGFAFQLVAAELARLDPNSDILRRAQLIIEGVQGVFADTADREPAAPLADPLG